MSRYILVPVSESTGKQSITIPDDLVTNDLYEDIKPDVINKKKLKDLIIQLAMNSVEEAENGGIMWKDKHFSNVNLRQALIDTCNSEFLEKHEDFYRLLRKFDIVF